MANAADRLASVGSNMADQAVGFGLFTRFCAETFQWIFRYRPGVGRLRLLTPQLYQVGTKSLPVVMLVGAFVGAVLAVETFDQFAAFGQEERLGGVINISVIKQIGPVLAAVMIAGRVGGAVSAELGTMRVTEQLDALRAMGANPIGHLVVPRVAACLIMVPILTLFSDLMGIIGAQLVTVNGFGVDAIEYRRFSREFVETYDLMSGVIKSVFF